MAGEVLAGLSALKTAFDIAKGLKDIDDATKRSAAVIELQEKILSAQQEQFALTEQLRGLQNKMAALDTWEAEKNRYELTDFGGGTLAYALKQSMANGEPPHRLCSACYQNRKKGILQPTGISAYKQEMVKCSECGKDFMLAIVLSDPFRLAPSSPHDGSSEPLSSDFPDVALLLAFALAARITADSPSKPRLLLCPSSVKGSLWLF